MLVHRFEVQQYKWHSYSHFPLIRSICLLQFLAKRIPHKSILPYIKQFLSEVVNGDRGFQKFIRLVYKGLDDLFISAFSRLRIRSVDIFPFRYGLDRLLSRLCQDKRSCNEAYAALQAGIGSTYECADLCLSFYK